MSVQEPLTTTRIQALFAEEIAALGGTVSNTFNDGSRLFARAILPRFREVGLRDSVQCGVALRATEQDALVHPYVFRLVCKNGAIIAHAVQTEAIENLGTLPPEVAASRLREAIRACGSEEPFAAAAEAMQSAHDREADFLLQMMPLIERMGAHVLDLVMEQLLEGRDMSRFGVMNAITAAARDTADPELRWRLEELGGGIPAGILPHPTRDNDAALSLREAYEALRTDRPSDLSHREERELAVA